MLAFLKLPTRKRNYSVFTKPNTSNNSTARSSVDISSLTTSVQDLEQLVKLPSDQQQVTKKDWIAQHAIDFSENLLLLLDSMHLKNECTESTCPCMTGGDCHEYRWIDDESPNEKYHQPCEVSAPQYIGLLFEWIELKINDPKVFPKDDEPYPKKFDQIAQKIFARLFRVFAHIYYRHGGYVNNLGISAHLNTLFKHFVLFTLQWDLIKKDEYTPCNSVIVKLLGPNYASKFNVSPESI